MIRLEHAAIWCRNLELMKDFYVRYFHVTANTRYHNPVKQFSSYFLQFSSGARLELMHRPDIREPSDAAATVFGYHHLAFSLGSKENVDALTERLRADGLIIAGEPRTTGDGYYESVVLDPEGNHIELTV